MITHKSWKAYPATYRAAEMEILGGWIAAGESGSVVGLAGCGRSNLLGFLCHRPEALRSYLPARADTVVAMLVDLNNLPTNNLSTLYRTILRAFYQDRHRFEASLQQTISALYLENRAARDPFLPQSALHDLLLLFQDQQVQVVLVLNRFDRFCETAGPQMINTLRGLRDSFKDTLCYIVGMRQAVTYLPEPTALGDMYELLDNHVCWVGSMSESDARWMLTRIVRPVSDLPSEETVRRMLALSGNFPALLREVILWWAAQPDQLQGDDLAERLLAEGSIQHRLDKMWKGLTQEEQLVLSEIQKLQASRTRSKGAGRDFKLLVKQDQSVIDTLVLKDLCQPTEEGWQIKGRLLTAYVAKAEGRSRGKIWLDEKMQNIYQGQKLVEDLTALHKDILIFLIKRPWLQHTKTDLIFNCWPDELRKHGVTDDALFQAISAIRRHIESNPAKPRYLVTWRGKPEGGYQFFPEGRPE